MHRARRLTLCLLLALMLVLPALPAAGQAVAPAAKAEFTLMYYMNGSDLESGKDDPEAGGSATGDLQEMMAVGSTADVNVVIETLGTKLWQTPRISNEGNQRWLVKQGGLELLDGDLGNKRLDDPQTLTDFITWAVQAYPAER